MNLTNLLKVIRYQNITTDLKRDKYYEIDELILHSCFSLLVEYVEEQLSHMYACQSPKRYDRLYPKRFIFFRGCNKSLKSQYGLAYLDWEMSLDDEYAQQQKTIANEVKNLYIWWIKIRPNRHFPEMPENSASSDEWFNYALAMEEIEDKFFKEDTVMLQKLIVVRNSLWT